MLPLPGPIRKNKMPIAVLLVFIAVPLLEIALLIKAGDSFGFWPTLSIVIFTAILGTVMLRWQGMAVMSRAEQTLREGGMPVESVADGVFLLLAGAFLLTPGLLTDGIGFALLVPQIRRWLGTKILRALSQRMGLGDVNDPGEKNSTAAGGAKPHRDRSGNVIIDAEYKDLDAP